MTDSEEKKSLPEIIDIHYLKTSSYRSYYVDGVIGSPTAHGKIYIELCGIIELVCVIYIVSLLKAAV